MISDRLSPILVKELRQGMRARVFEGAFLLMQVLMVFSIVMAVIAVMDDQPDMHTAFSEGVFWTMVGIPVLLIMPMRGCNALRQEIDGQSLELLFLTRLSAWRIVAGKWAALLAQTALLVCAILPYAVVRYYLGGVHVLRDLYALATLFGVSALLSALTVSVSAFPSKLARGMIFIFPLVLLQVAPMMVVWIGFSMGTGTGWSAPVSSWQVMLTSLFYGLVMLFYILEFGAARVAPVAENHALVKRCLGLLLLVTGPLFWWISGEAEILWLHLGLLVPVCLDALCTNREIVPGVYRSLLRFGAGGRYVSPLFLPVWSSGVLFILLVCAGMLACLGGAGLLADEDQLLLSVAVFSSLLAPAALIALFRPQTRKFPTLYFALQLTGFILVILFLTVNEAFNMSAEALLSCVPIGSFMMGLFQEGEAEWVIPNLVILLGSVAALLVRSGPVWSALRPIRDAALAGGHPGDVAAAPEPAN